MSSENLNVVLAPLDLQGQGAGCIAWGVALQNLTVPNRQGPREMTYSARTCPTGSCFPLGISSHLGLQQGRVQQEVGDAGQEAVQRCRVWPQGRSAAPTGTHLSGMWLIRPVTQTRCVPVHIIFITISTEFYINLSLTKRLRDSAVGTLSVSHGRYGILQKIMSGNRPHEENRPHLEGQEVPHTFTSRLEPVDRRTWRGQGRSIPGPGNSTCCCDLPGSRAVPDLLRPLNT